MNDGVAAALAARPRGAEGFGAMTIVSAVGHAVLLTMVLLMPAEWRSRAVDAPRDVMTISLGGAPGPRAGGMTALGGRPVQEVAPPDTKPKPQPPQAPAAKPPAMIEPVKSPKPAAKTPEPAPKTTTQQAAGRTATRGAEVMAGSAVAQTGGTGIGFGLSTGGGGGTGGEINLGNFCCPDYLQTMLQIIQRNWNSKQQVAGVAAVRFTVQRDGTMTDVQLAQPSGFAVLDLAAQRAILMSRLPPLPREYSNNQLTITLSFNYQR